MWYNISITTEEVDIMPNKSTENNQKNEQLRESSSIPGHHRFASVQVDNDKPVKDNDRPVKPPKKGK